MLERMLVLLWLSLAVLAPHAAAAFFAPQEALMSFMRPFWSRAPNPPTFPNAFEVRNSQLLIGTPCCLLCSPIGGAPLPSPVNQPASSFLLFSVKLNRPSTHLGTAYCCAYWSKQCCATWVHVVLQHCS